MSPSHVVNHIATDGEFPTGTPRAKDAVTTRPESPQSPANLGQEGARRGSIT